MQNSEEAKKARVVQLSVREALSSKKEESKKDFRSSQIDFDGDDEIDDFSFDVRMRQQILEKRKELGDHPPKSKSSKGFVLSLVLQLIRIK